jgi:hypothetical protein
MLARIDANGGAQMTASHRRIGRRLAAALATIALVWVTPVGLTADDDGKGPHIVGAWRLTINPGTPGEFYALVNYHGDQTQSATSSLVFLSPAKGAWKKIPGRGRFAITHATFWDCPGRIPGCVDGVFDAVINTRGTVQVADDDTLSGTLSSEFVLLDGTPLFSTRGAFIGTRMKVVAE